VRPNGTRWLSHSYLHACPLAEDKAADKAHDYNLKMGWIDATGQPVREEPPQAQPAPPTAKRVSRSRR